MAQTTIPTVNDSMLRDVVERLRSVGDPLRIVLFGSQARGTPHERSDLDLLIVDDQLTKRPIDAAGDYRQSLSGIDFPRDIDVMVTTPEEIEEWSRASLAFVTTALREGKVLYERQH